MTEHPHEILIRVKDGLKKCVTNYDMVAEISREDFDKCRLIILKLCNEDGLDVPKVVDSCLDPEEFLTHTYDGIRENTEAFLFIQETFNPFINLLRSKSVMVQFIPVVFNPPEKLTYKHIYEEIDKCDRKIIEQDFAGAITNARSLLEGVLKEIIYQVSGTHPDPKYDLVKLHNEARNLLNLDPSKPEIIQSLKQIISGLASAVQGLASLRNTVGDSHSRVYEPGAHHAILAVNSAKTLASFLFSTYEYQKTKGLITERNAT